MVSSYDRNQRGARGGYCSDRNGNRAYSNSSGGSNDHHSSFRPTLRPASAPQPPDTVSASPAPTHMASSAPPTEELSSFDLNGHTINQTYVPNRFIFPVSPREAKQESEVDRNIRRQSNADVQHRSDRPVLRDEGTHWAYRQEEKIKLRGVPKSYWTKDVYEAMSVYGTVFRIDMVSGTIDNIAWVVFRPPPLRATPYPRVRIGTASVHSEARQPQVTQVPSPSDAHKQHFEFNILPAKAISFGVRIADKTMIAMRTVESTDGITMTLNLTRKEIDIQFPLKIDSEMRKFRFRLPIALLSVIYKSTCDNTNQATLVIPFNSPPQFFVQKNEGEDLGAGRRYTSFSQDKFWNNWSTWHRETDVVDSSIRNTFAQAPLMNHKDTAIIDIGQWTEYCLTFDDATLTGPQFKHFSDALVAYGVAIKDPDQYIMKPRDAPPLWSLLQEEIAGTHPHIGVRSTAQGSSFDNLFTGQIHLGFPVRYQLEVCLSNGYIKEHAVTMEFLQKLQSMESEKAISILEKVADKQHTYYNPMEIFGIRIKTVKSKTPSYCTLQRSVIITPTMMHVASPIMETSNRITRKYEADSDRFIRVRFSDEKTEGQLRNMPDGRAEAIFDRVFRAMRNGVVVAGRYYVFLAFGNSQFRAHGAYFYAPTSSKSADDIRMSLGTFHHIKTVAKFGARLGQCFSTTRETRIQVKNVRIPDIERNGYVFTDGVGKLSFFVAHMAADQLGLANASTNPPSLFQFRLGGCKGVLAQDPNVSGVVVHTRPSQHKFDTPSERLEIIRSSSLATPYFNRQIIMVLSYLGVPDDVFLRMQKDMLDNYKEAMRDERTALQMLTKNIDINQTTLTIASMILDGFMGTRDPFIMSLLLLWRAYTIKNLKEKARIAIDKGAFVLGCVDETATLKGHMNDPQSRLDATRDEKLATLPEIFLQVDDTSKKGPCMVIEGVCVLARNPSLHPGDVRVVRAVNVPALGHLKNVVVLPQTGDRDLANMCSGGDLDGDDYMVLWDSVLIPSTINVQSMEFTPEKPIETDKPITAADISEFFVTYMKNDALGQIAHAHLAQADFRSDGVGDPVCLELAELHSKAVDFPKSGITAEMTRELRPNIWPHFMEKKHLPENRTYRSEKVLGRMFDEVQLIDFEPQWRNAFDRRILDAYDLDKEMLDKAKSFKASYDEQMRRLMAKHSVKTEFEAWSLFVLAHNHESRDYKFAEEFGRTVETLKAQQRELCRQGSPGSLFGTLVAAMYTVTAREMQEALDDGRAMDAAHMPLISFPWLFPEELGRIALSEHISE